MQVMEDNKVCPNCEFDTMPIVTVEVKNWDYCPVCGSGMRGMEEVMKSGEDEDTEMRKIEINGDDDKAENNKNDSTESVENNDEDKDTNTDNSDQDKVDIEEELQDEDPVEEELDRLRERFGSDDQESE